MSRPLPGDHRRRKGLSLDGSVPGLEYNRFHAGHDRGVLDGQPQIGLPQPEQVYDPHPGRMEVFEPSYEGYDWQPRPLATSPLHMDPVERPHEPRMSLYDKGAQLFAIQDQQELEMRELSFERMDSCVAHSDVDVSLEPAGLRSHDDPIDRLAIELSINKAAMDHAAVEPLLQAEPADMLEQIVRDFSDPAAEMAAGLEQQMQEMDQQAAAMEPPPPEYDQAQQIFDEQMQQLMNGFGMPGPMM